MSQIVGQIMTADPVVMAVSAGPAVVISAAAPVVLTISPAPGAVLTTSQGAEGPRGRPGADFTGFGSVDYTDLDAGTPINLPAGQWVQIVRRTQPSGANFAPLAGPWAGFTFWDGAALHARAIGDVYLFKFTFSVIPDQRNSGLRFAVRPGDNAVFDFGPEPIVLSVDAGEMQTGSETFFEQVRTRFATSGAEVYVMSTSGATLTSFSPEITPLSHT